MLINESRLQKALTYLAETDEPAAGLRADVERAEFKAKAVKDAVFLISVGSSVAERVAVAGTNKEYTAAMNEYFEALRLSDAMRNKRSTETIVIDTWRSLNSGRNKGNIT
jgi:Asp/Glu/hydantoin racemase